MLGLAACGGGAAGSAPAPAAPPSDGGGDPGDGPSALEAEILDLVNAERTSRGLAALAWHPGAADVARAHSTDMAARDFFDHVNPDGLDPGDRLAAAGIHPSAWGENIAAGYPDAASVMDAWMNSPGHRANILNPIYTHLGVGICDAGSMAPYWTQDFLRLP
jgi:uncharacterized protein YkwD